LTPEVLGPPEGPGGDREGEEGDGGDVHHQSRHGRETAGARNQV